MSTGTLRPYEARRMAAFMLGIPLDADDTTALRAFRLLSARHDPNNGGDKSSYGAVLGAWATWVSTGGATDDGAMELTAAPVVTPARALEQAALTEMEHAVARRIGAVTDGTELPDEISVVDDLELDDEDTLIILDLETSEMEELASASLRIRDEARELAALPGPYRAYRTAGSRGVTALAPAVHA